MGIGKTTRSQALATWMEDSGCLIWVVCLSLLITFVLFFEVMAFGERFVMMQATSTYVRGNCTIRARVYDSVTRMDPDDPGAMDTAEFLEYSVWVNGRAYYDYGVRYRVPDEAKEIVDRYAIGQLSPCWYNPTHPEEAVFYRDDQLGQQFMVRLLSFTLFLLLSVLLIRRMRQYDTAN